MSLFKFLSSEQIAAIVVTIFALFIYAVLKWRHRYWHRRGVPYLKPHLLFGNMEDVVLRNTPDVLHFYNLYNKTAPHKFVGFFLFHRPALLLRDPEIVKHIMVKDFPYFCDRIGNFLDENDPLSYHLFNLRGDQWKALRAKLTPTFTSGKMKIMFQLMKECADLMDSTIDERLREVGGNLEIEIKDLLARYSTDVIGSCAFGLQTNSLQNPKSEFREMGKKVLEITLRAKMINLMNTIYPKLLKMFGITFVRKEVSRYFLNLVRGTIKYRDESNIKRNDFLNILMGLRKEKSSINELENKIEMTIELIAAQCFIFFVAGFETASGVLSVCLLELAHQQNLQEKLRSEIDKSVEGNDGELTYELINSMPYMDKVVSEALRMYPSLSFLFRECTKPYRIPNTDIVLEKGTEVFIPVYGIHRDPQYYPNPHKFNPENFTEENKASRPSCTYLPFGEGPRICIGARFGLMQIKLALATLIKRYRFDISPKMKLPVSFVPKTFVTTVDGGVWLNCTKR